MATRMATKVEPKKFVLKLSPSTNRKTKSPSEEKVSTRASAGKATATRAKRSTVPEKTTVKAAEKKSPVKTPDRVIATDNPNLLDPDRDGGKKLAGMSYRQISEKLGFGIGTEQFLAAVELLKGGQTRLEVNDRVKALLPATTQNGTPKQVTNLVSGVLNKMINSGFAVHGVFKIVQVKSTSTK